MKFTFDRDAMIKEISIAQEIITNKSPVTILSNILIIAENNMLTIKVTIILENLTAISLLPKRVVNFIKYATIGEWS